MFKRIFQVLKRCLFPFQLWSPAVAGWHNSKSAELYENLDASAFEKAAKINGLDTWCDLRILEAYLVQMEEFLTLDTSILDLGSGYGRVLDYLLAHGYHDVTSVERSQNLGQFLKSKYQGKVPVHATDLVQFESGRKFDLILLLWGGIADFSKGEQPSIIKKLVGLLKPEGFLILDGLPTPVKSSRYHKTKDGQTCVYSHAGKVSQAYYPSIEQMARYSHDLGLEYRIIEYKTTTNRRRMLHILKKVDINQSLRRSIWAPPLRRT